MPLGLVKFYLAEGFLEQKTKILQGQEQQKTEQSTHSKKHAPNYQSADIQHCYRSPKTLFKHEITIIYYFNSTLFLEQLYLTLII